jgi:hypothetical protein
LNEDICDIFMNEVKVEDEPLQEFEENENVWKEGSRNLEKKLRENDFFLEWCMHKDYFKNHIAKMNYVGHFSMLMITKKLI